jgi:tail sheath stabilizer
MFGQTYYWASIRKYISLFGTLFNDISIMRTDTANNTTAFVKVPITYSHKDKMLARVQEDPTVQRPTATLSMPVMAFEMTNLRYDGARKLSTVNRMANVANTDPTKLLYQYVPVPFNIDFSLYIMVKNSEDGAKIVEQILPYFTPDFTASLILIPEMNVKMDVPTILHTVQQEDTYSGDFKTRQVLTWTLGFTMKAAFYGPVKKIPQIRFVNANFYTPEVPDGQLYEAVGNTASVATVHVQPGLTANGQPTSNALLSINPNEIYATEDFGYVVDVTEPGGQVAYMVGRSYGTSAAGAVS